MKCGKASIQQGSGFDHEKNFLIYFPFTFCSFGTYQFTAYSLQISSYSYGQSPLRPLFEGRQVFAKHISKPAG